MRRAKGLALLLASVIAVAGFLFPVRVQALEDPVPIAAVSLNDRIPLEAVPVTGEEVAEPGAYVNDYLDFSRSELVAYLVHHAEQYLKTPYTYDAYANPVIGEEGGMQCESFVWSALFNVAKKNRADVPCGTAVTQPVGNGGGWVDWAYYHGIEPLQFATKEEMLASGVLEKGDIIWSFDVAGPYGISAYHHVGFFWGDTPGDDKFWHCAEETDGVLYAGVKNGNRITKIQSMTDTPSIWWVFKLSPDADYQASEWKGLPISQSGTVRASTAVANAAAPQVMSADRTRTAEAEAEPQKEIVFYGG